MVLSLLDRRRCSQKKSENSLSANWECVKNHPDGASCGMCWIIAGKAPNMVGPTVWAHCVWNCKYLTLMILAWQFLISSAPKCFHPCLQSRFGFARKGKIVWTYLQSHLMRDMFWIHWTTHHLRYALANMTQRKKPNKLGSFRFCPWISVHLQAWKVSRHVWRGRWRQENALPR